MSKVIQFKREEEQPCCPTCDLILSHIEGISESRSYEELFDRLAELVAIAQDEAVAEYLSHEIEAKVGLFAHLTGQDHECDECCDECCEDFCDECDCEDEY